MTLTWTMFDCNVSDVQSQARRRIATGLERGRAGLLRCSTCTGPEARAGEAGADSARLIARARRQD